jgi:hypothetical protein
VQRKRKDKIRLTLNPCHNRVLFLVTVVCLFVCLLLFHLLLTLLLFGIVAVLCVCVCGASVRQ